MATIIERDVSRGDDGMSSMMTAIVGIIAILAIIGVAFYVFRLYPVNQSTNPDTTPINIDVNTPEPGSTTY